jgi:hypothetical protein
MMQGNYNEAPRMLYLLFKWAKFGVDGGVAVIEQTF